ncbi:hypothetical protein KAU43_04200 [candidate division WOR-3 bacterium]|nr:hypothetical protein [candidate division WOR-3 bacterium]
MGLKKMVTELIDDGIKVATKVKKYVIDDTVKDVEKIIGTSDEKKEKDKDE